MTENTNTTYRNRITTFLFGNRIVISKGTHAGVNLPILAGIIAALCAIRLTVFAVIIAMVFGYRFSIEKCVSKSFDATVKDAADKTRAAAHEAASKVKSAGAQAFAQVKDAVENIKQEIKDGLDDWDGVEDHH